MEKIEFIMNWKKLLWEIAKAVVYAIAGFFGGNAVM